MDSGDGPSQRKQATELYRLTPKPPVWWGYRSGSSSTAAAAILDDVLPNALPAEVLADMSRELRSELVNGLKDDFLAYFHDGKEFWLAAPTVVRWIHGYLQLRPPHAPGGSC
jgi:hypothetical protein